ncbi:baseplate J/gp47 family protein [Aquimarina sp. ERC-38]|uniref:baseplate J/gp47 family protein n=1 Tax=Aquimarina sp. ERC-38 TaxID=2949996 RepID=UPI002244FD47|nr:baseplate J/gp47 family protein [Aquimarina sp. ERC-38]UZO81758.1 baseplate J/gp47 family protein [Aquimarina sp. ERC-38]
MSENCSYIDSILRRNGRDQQQRFNEILNPDSLKLHDLGVEDWMLFAYNFAKHVNYFNTENENSPLGDWQDLFRYFDFNEDTIPLRGETTYQKLKDEITATLQEQEYNGEVTPHFTLFVCFLRLLELSQNRFNTLTKRHLDFYFSEILQVEKLSAKADKVHLLFEIAKKSISERIPEGTKLDGGKDANRKKRIYKTSEELVANKATVALLKNVYNHQERELDPADCAEKIIDAEIKTADIANSFDGKGEEFPEGFADWWAFGYPSNEGTYPDLDNVKTGFGLASQMFSLKEGERTVQITINQVPKRNPSRDDTEPCDPKEAQLELPPETFAFDDLYENITIYCSTEEGWYGPLKLEESKTIGTASYETRMQSNKLSLLFEIPQDAPSITGYNKEVHLEPYTTDLPVVRFLIDTNKKEIGTTQDGEATYSYAGYNLNRRLALNTLSSMQAKVHVDSIVSLELENDTGIINVDKPFYPFTTDPINKSNFDIGYPEVFSKPWKSINIDITWKDTPEVNFADQYTNYGTLPTVNDSYFKATSSVFENNRKRYIIEKSDVVLFKKSGDLYKTDFSFSSSQSAGYKNGPLRLSLNQSFLQERFPKTYALAISRAILDAKEESKIPKEPYIPLIETISMSYNAEASTNLQGNKVAYANNQIKLFHEDPYGQHEEHRFLKESIQEIITGSTQERNDFLTNHLVPKHCRGGSLFIGLENAEINQQISLLIQVLEGSENPDDEGFLGNQRVEWAVLSNNHWKDLQDNILINSTDNLLTSGIIRFTIPKQATTNNTRLPEGYIWIRARIHKNYDAVSKIKSILPQAVLTTFEDQDNDLSHLETSLPDGTISKLITRVPQVKSITQPYNSFDGSPQESDEAYYRRISERLRHKNRAVTLWDYENLVLQEFPEIYQVKCLNHTNMKASQGPSFLAPGYVTLVVIPDTIDKNVFDIFQPRVSKATLNKVMRYINKLNTIQVETQVVNPTYEEVEVSLSVKFYDQYDENFYTKQLSEDITKFLSPWAFNTSRTIDFGATLHRSVLIDYLEELFYVDYLQDVIVKRDGEIFNSSVQPSNPASILVSAKQHQVSTNIEKCKENNEEKIETCEI